MHINTNIACRGGFNIRPSERVQHPPVWAGSIYRRIWNPPPQTKFYSKRIQYTGGYGILPDVWTSVLRMRADMESAPTNKILLGWLLWLLGIIVSIMAFYIIAQNRFARYNKRDLKYTTTAKLQLLRLKIYSGCGINSYPIIFNFFNFSHDEAGPIL